MEIQIALYYGPGTGGQGPVNLKQKLNNHPYSIETVSSEDIRLGVLIKYDVVIFAGGGGQRQANALGEYGRDQVKSFLRDGGGYLGICAGAYLATSGFSWGLGLINAKTVSPLWARGKGTVKIRLTELGNNVFGVGDGNFDIFYNNGPIVTSAGRIDLEDFEALAIFQTELAERNSPAEIMINSPAIFSSGYGNGKVICFSPHPEQTSGLEEMIPRAVDWLCVPRVQTIK